MDTLTKERNAKQRAAARQKAESGGIDARREYLKMALKTLDAAIEKTPDSDLLKAQRTDLATELHRMELPSECERLNARLAEVEGQLAIARGFTSQQMLDLIALRTQIITDLARFGK